VQNSGRGGENHGSVNNLSIKQGDTVMPNYFKQMCEKVRNERGQGLVEYALILVLIAVVVIAAVTTIGQKANNTFSTVGNSMGK
jgi:pilus assembly protein Flp/PilA